MFPLLQGVQGGEIFRLAQLRTGSSTTRLSSSRLPTTSCPGVKGKETRGSKYRADLPSTVARSEPQIPESLGRTFTQSFPGISGLSS